MAKYAILSSILGLGALTPCLRDEIPKRAPRIIHQESSPEGEAATELMYSELHESRTLRSPTELNATVTGQDMLVFTSVFDQIFKHAQNVPTYPKKNPNCVCSRSM